MMGYNPFGRIDKYGRHLLIRPSQSQDRKYEAIPNANAFVWGTQYHINSYGFRGKEYKTEKDKNVYRIVILGDSIAFGNMISMDDAFSQQLETFFNNQKKNVEVLNLGLGGYDTLQEVATLEDIGVQFHPDLVVVGYCLNDIGVSSPNLQYIRRIQKYGSPVYRIRLAQLLRAKMDRLELKFYSRNMNIDEEFAKENQGHIVDISRDKEINDLLNHLREVTKGKEVPSFVREYTSSVHVGKLRYAMERLKGTSEKSGTKVIMLIIPFLLEKGPAADIYKAVYDIIEYESLRLGFDIVSPYEHFKAAGFDNLLISKDDGIHPNSYGHNLMAKQLYEHITAGFIDKKH